MEDSVDQVQYSLAGYRLLAQVIEVAIAKGLMKKKERLAPYQDYVAERRRERDECNEENISVRPIAPNVETMIEYLDAHGLLPDAAARERYLELKYGKNPIRAIRKRRKRCERDGIDYRQLRQAGALVCFQSGDSRWGGGEARPSSGLIAALGAARIAEMASRAREFEDANDGDYDPWGRRPWRRPGS